MKSGIFIRFLVGGFYGNPLVQYVNSHFCTLRFEMGVKGGLFVGGAPKCINIGSKLKLAFQSW